MVIHRPKLRRRGPAFLRPRLASLSYTPMQVDAAYGIPIIGSVPTQKIGIVSLGGGWSLKNLNSPMTAWNLPLPVVQVLHVNGAKPGTYGQSDADGENMLDLQRVCAMYSRMTGQPTHVAIAFAENADPLGIANAWLALHEWGAVSIGTSWGAPRSLWNPMAMAYTHGVAVLLHDAGVTNCVAAGDNSIDDGENSPEADFPGGDPYACAIGGTSLYLNPDGSINQERAWGDGVASDEGGGGGYDPDYGAAPWQLAALPRGVVRRGVPDFAFNADPNTGTEFMLYDEWTVFGGTSVGAPAYAGLFAGIKGYLAREAQKLGMATAPTFGHPGSILYPAAKTAFRDVILGSNGYPAAPGWDPATGLGTPNGPGFLAAFDSLLAAPAVVAGAPARGNAPAEKIQEVSAPLAGVEGVRSVFTNYKQRAADLNTLAHFTNMERDVLRAMKGRPAKPRSTASVALTAAIGALQEMVRVYGPLAESRADAYIASLPISPEQKAFLTQIVGELLGARAEKSAQLAGLRSRIGRNIERLNAILEGAGVFKGGV